MFSKAAVPYSRCPSLQLQAHLQFQAIKIVTPKVLVVSWTAGGALLLVGLLDNPVSWIQSGSLECKPMGWCHVSPGAPAVSGCTAELLAEQPGCAQRLPLGLQQCGCQGWGLWPAPLHTENLRGCVYSCRYFPAADIAMLQFSCSFHWNTRGSSSAIILLT